MARAAKNFSHGKGEKRKDGQPIKYNFKIGDEIPDDIADEIDDSLILEKVAAGDPEELSRDQLMILANLTGQDEGATIEYDEEDLREAIGELNRKSDVMEWFETVRPESDLLEPGMTRDDMVDLIVEELTGE